jgi:predicted dithiol-disulfide oxidoreductase (DUF899 family)
VAGSAAKLLEAEKDSTYARGVEALMGTYQFFDLAPWGRNEDRLEFPRRGGAAHDEYPKG